jgi:GNAT superfamily N-acetyltransferase
LEIRPADLDDAGVRELVRFHHADMQAMSPPEFSFALDIDKLRAPGIRVLAAYDGRQLLGIGAVALSDDEAELKSMRTVPGKLRRGVGTALLDALTRIARDAGVRTVYLETGTGPGFEAAWQLYLRNGFEPSGPFADYEESDFNRYMRKAILVDLIAGKGVAGDAHCGAMVKHRSRVAADPSQPNLRQVHLIAAELLDELGLVGFALGPGDLGENVLTRGLDLMTLPRCTRLRIGDEVELELTGLRNPCGQIEAFRPGLLARVASRDESGAIVRRAGVMAIVLSGGRISPGDPIEIALPPLPHEALDRV